jgi:hypothetical protein
VLNILFGYTMDAIPVSLGKDRMLSKYAYTAICQVLEIRIPKILNLIVLMVVNWLQILIGAKSV